MQSFQRCGHFPRGLMPFAVALPVDELLEVHAVDQDLRVAVVAVLLGVIPCDLLIVERGGLRAHATKDAYLFHVFSKISSATLLLDGSIPLRKSALFEDRRTWRRPPCPSPTNPDKLPPLVRRQTPRWPPRPSDQADLLKKGIQFSSLVGREVVAGTQNGAARQTHDLQSGFQNAYVDVTGSVSRQNPGIPPAPPGAHACKFIQTAGSCDDLPYPSKIAGIGRLQQVNRKLRRYVRGPGNETWATQRRLECEQQVSGPAKDRHLRRIDGEDDD